jgi:hypothetical protein
MPAIRAGSARGAILAEDVGDDFLGDRFGRGEKQVIHNRFPAVSHRQGFGNKAEARNLLQSAAKGGDDLLVALLDHLRPEETGLLIRATGDPQMW